MTLVPPYSRSVPDTTATRLTGTGLLAETVDRGSLVNGQVLTSGTIYFVLVGLSAGTTVSNLSFGLTANAVTTTLNKVGLYDTGGNRLALSADISASVTAGAPKIVTAAMLTPYAVPTTGVYYCAVIGVDSTVISVLRGASNNAAQLAIGSNPAAAGVQTGQTDLVNPAAITAGSGFVIWFGVS